MLPVVRSPEWDDLSDMTPKNCGFRTTTTRTLFVSCLSDCKYVFQSWTR